MNREKFLRDLEERPLGLDDTFQFGCKACGKCCKDKLIMLNPYDIYRLAKHLKMIDTAFVYTYCGLTIGKDSHLPIVFLDFKNGACPFLVNKKCSVHAEKPYVCASYPLGRTIKDDRIVYFNQELSCGNKYEKQKCRRGRRNLSGME